MAKTRVQKIEDIKKLTEKLSRSKSVVFADYRGLTMKQLVDLRNKLAEQAAEFNITKNTLLKRALENLKLKIKNSQLFEGPIATLFSYEDEVSPIKTLVKALKDAQLGQIKAGLLDTQVLDNLAINHLASLPGKLELQAKVVGSLAAPLYGIAGVLQANLRNLVYALEQIKQQRG